MPAKSQAQQRFMGMCSTVKGRAKVKGKCPPMAVAKEYAHAPKGKKLFERVKTRKLGRE